MTTKTLSGEVEVSQASTSCLINSDRFYTQPKTAAGKVFFIFQEYEDFIKGELLSKHTNAHINRTCSYRIIVWEMRRGGQDVPVKNNQIEEFFANRQLQRIIDYNELIGSIVRIVYVGRLKSNFGGHSAKVYRVFKDKGIYTEFEEKQNEPTKRKRAEQKRGRQKAAAAS